MRSTAALLLGAVLLLAAAPGWSDATIKLLSIIGDCEHEGVGADLT